jgi:hypothetical protein
MTMCVNICLTTTIQDVTVVVKACFADDSQLVIAGRHSLMYLRHPVAPALSAGRSVNRRWLSATVIRRGGK